MKHLNVCTLSRDAVICLRTFLPDDDPPAHGRQDEPSADVRRVPPRHRHRAGARTRAARVHTRGTYGIVYSVQW